MIFNINKEYVIYMHSLLISEIGGLDGIRDVGLLESAVNAPFATFGGVDLYPDIQSKAARLAFGLISNHAFADGNKRIGILALITFLNINKCEIEVTEKELIELGLKVADGSFDENDIKEFIVAHFKQ